MYRWSSTFPSPKARMGAKPSSVDMDTSPFDPLDYLDFELPWDGLDAD
jgi:hypothetical protein